MYGSVKGVRRVNAGPFIGGGHRRARGRQACERLERSPSDFHRRCLRFIRPLGADVASLTRCFAPEGHASLTTASCLARHRTL